MFYTGLDPRDMTEVYVPRDPNEKAMQRALMQYNKPYNHDLVVKALRKAHREDLIGWDHDCLVPPYIKNKPNALQKSTKNGAKQTKDGAKQAKAVNKRAETRSKSERGGKRKTAKR